MEENQALDGTLNCKWDSTKITWMKAKYLMTFNLDIAKSTYLGKKKG